MYVFAKRQCSSSTRMRAKRCLALSASCICLMRMLTGIRRPRLTSTEPFRKCRLNRLQQRTCRHSHPGFACSIDLPSSGPHPGSLAGAKLGKKNYNAGAAIKRPDRPGGDRIGRSYRQRARRENDRPEGAWFQPRLRARRRSHPDVTYPLKRCLIMWCMESFLHRLGRLNGTLAK